MAYKVGEDKKFDKKVEKIKKRLRSKKMDIIYNDALVDGRSLKIGRWLDQETASKLAAKAAKVLKNKKNVQVKVIASRFGSGSRISVRVLIRQKKGETK